MATGDRIVTAGSTASTTREQIDALFARRQEAWDNFDADAIAADYTDDAVIESPLSGRHGKAQAAQNIQPYFDAFMDLKLTAEALIVDGDRVAQIVTSEGTNMGGLMGLPASGKTFKLPTVFIFELRDGRIAHERRIYDFTGMLIQVGVLKAKPA